MSVTPTSVLALLIISVGILGVIISFLITDRKKYVIALVLSGCIISTGLFQYVKREIRQRRTASRIAKLQKKQRQNLRGLQDRIRQNRSRLPSSQKTVDKK